jgi:predicted RNA-binding Zn-ribbon protein involved in translation (DUF1610 family)
MICAYCKADIEHDSFFCDQCGEELLICEKCGKPGKGKRCTDDGGKLISAKDKTTTQTNVTSSPAASFNGNFQQQTTQVPNNTPLPSTNTSANISNPTVLQNAPNNNFVANKQQVDTTQRVPTNTINAGYATTVPGLNNVTVSGIPQCVIINKAINATLQINDGEIIGRKAGNYVNIFGSFNQISGRHAQFNYNNQVGWVITDLGSSNGTKYQGQPLIPNVPVPIKDKTFVVFANIEFFVQIAALPTNNNSNFDADRTFRL